MLERLLCQFGTLAAWDCISGHFFDMRYRLFVTLAVLLVGTGQLIGCAASPEPRGTLGLGIADVGQRVVEAAEAAYGAPYRYGGIGDRGFDCSGLVFYAHHRAGVPVPRTTADQSRAATRVGATRLRPGDVLFFRLRSPKLSHVGIYTGGGRFLHAPSAGKQVSYASLSNPFWRERLLHAGRLY